MVVNSYKQNFDKKQIRTFLQSTNFRRFNLFPDLKHEDICDYSLHLLDNSFNNGKLFISQNSQSEIEVILSFKILKWDSNHFGFKCAVIDQYFYNHNLQQEILSIAFNKLISDILQYAVNEKVRFISMSVNSWDYFFSTILQHNNFNYILTWLDGVYVPISSLPVLFPENEFSPVKDEEIDIYSKMAKNSYFEGGRFYLDKKFNNLLVKEMYSSLVSSSFRNKDIMLSYRIDGEPVGLFICKKIEKLGVESIIRIAPLRFLLISSTVRTKNIGLDIFSRTLNYLKDKSDIITTGLEIHNIPSLNLHSKLRFKFNYTHNMFHWWAS